MQHRTRFTRRQVLAGLTMGLASVACAPASTFGGGQGAPVPSPSPSPGTTGDGGPPCSATTAYMTFAINVHDWVHLDESAATLLRATSIFEKHGVHGDFYLTGEMVNRYRKSRPDVIERLRASQMTISYHVRPPHPLYDGFGGALKKLSDGALRQALLDYETYGLDMATGGLIRSEPGGWSLVAEALGTTPVVCGVPTGDPRIKAAAMENYRALGARMVVAYHETGTRPERPFEYVDGLLARPSDFSVTRWRAESLSATSQGGANDPFWWNFMGTPHEDAYNPTGYLQQRLSDWSEARPPFVTSLIHENNFPRSGPEVWTPIYWEGGDKSLPASPPYNMAAPDPSKLRTQSQAEAIWEAYEELVAYAAANLAVVTSAEIVSLAEASGTGGKAAPWCPGAPSSHG
ncbi:hypothetical protein EDM76_06620 [bacterium]|nr:MAG: hypothetical protein EDM76_06620 [bacterium]